MGRDHAQLYIGHDRRPEGRGLSSPRCAPARDRQRRHLFDGQAPGLSVDAADVSLQWLVLSLSISVVAGTHVCLRAVRAPAMYDAIANHKVTHLCGAPIVMATLLNAPANEKKPLPHVVEFFTAAAPPPEAVLAAMKEAGFNVTHLYGLTECYGPAVVNDWHDAWGTLPPAEQAAKKARQGVRYGALEALDVLA